MISELVAVSQDRSVEHRTWTPYCVVVTGASTNVELSVQSRRRVSPASPTTPLPLLLFQNWYCSTPFRHRSAVESLALKETI